MFLITRMRFGIVSQHSSLTLDPHAAGASKTNRQKNEYGPQARKKKIQKKVGVPLRPRTAGASTNNKRTTGTLWCACGGRYCGAPQARHEKYPKKTEKPLVALFGAPTRRRRVKERNKNQKNVVAPSGAPVRRMLVRKTQKNNKTKQKK